MCGMKAGCETFVFEPLSATCVLLPPVSEAKGMRPNPLRALPHPPARRRQHARYSLE